MLSEEQIKAIIEAAKADDAAEKLGALVSPMIQSAADAVVAEELEGIKKNRDEFKTDLGKFKPFGKPDEIQAKLEELKTLQSAKGKKVDQKEIDRLVEERLEDRVSTFRAEQEALRSTIEEERDGAKTTSEAAVSAVLRAKRRALLYEHAGPMVKKLMWPFYEERLGQMLRPVEAENGEPWWKKDVVSWKVVDPDTGAPLTGKAGGLTPAELVESGRMGLGDKDWNSKEFAETFFEPKGKGGGATSADLVPGSPSGAVSPDAPSYEDFDALMGNQ